MNDSNSDNLMSVAIDAKYVYIDLEIFKKLFEGSSHVYYLSDYQRAIAERKIKISKLIELARKARIPYSLFFAPQKIVDANIRHNEQLLFQGVDNGLISMAGRGNVEIKDINLIVKDIRKRQFFLAKHNKGVPDNPILHLQKEQDIQTHARNILKALNLDMDKMRGYKTKENAYKFLIDELERANILISRSQRGAMPQAIKEGVRFSGIAVKHKKYPAIFLYSKDESDIADPTGRRIFTIILLLVCMSLNHFSPVSYDSKLKSPIEVREYIIAEEILMSREMIDGAVIESIDDIRNLSSIFKVTPSMVLMRLKRLQLIDSDKFERYFEQLDDERKLAIAKSRNIPFKINETTRIINYNGRKFTASVLQLLSTGTISHGEACRLLGRHRKSTSFIEQIGAAL